MSEEVKPEEFNGVRKIVNLSTLQVDATYQRGLKPHHKKIAKKFDRSAAGELVVNQRPDGSLWLIDGQQRTGAMKALGIKEWPARVLSLKTVECEAAVFGRINGTEGTTAKVGERDKFKAMVAAKDPDVLGAIAAVAAGGMTLTRTGHVKWPHVANTAAVLSFYRIHGGEALTRAIKLIVDSWPGDDDACRGTVIETIMSFAWRYPDADYARAAKLFAMVPVTRVIQEAGKGGGGGRGSHLAGVAFLVGLYNKRLLDKNRLVSPK